MGAIIYKVMSGKQPFHYIPPSYQELSMIAELQRLVKENLKFVELNLGIDD